MNRLEKKS